MAWIIEKDSWKNGFIWKRRFEHSKYFMGRTEWDYQMSSLFSPNSSYYKVNECLRSIFYKDILPITKKSNNELVIISTISSTYYKGFDTILKTAKILRMIYLLTIHGILLV